MDIGDYYEIEFVDIYGLLERIIDGGCLEC